jgi:hypothetical protein
MERASFAVFFVFVLVVSAAVSVGWWLNIIKLWQSLAGSGGAAYPDLLRIFGIVFALLGAVLGWL